MTNNFASSPKYMLTSESVTEGHPDKLCDQISDSILDTIMAEDPNGRVACETAVTTGLVIVMGEITTSCYVDVPQIVRQVVKDIGYTNPKYGFDYQSCGVLVSIKEQSTDIDMGVSQALEVKKGASSSDDLDDALDSLPLPALSRFQFFSQKRQSCWPHILDCGQSLLP